MAVQVPIDWETVEDALQAWLARSTELEAIWRDQSAPQPPYPFASLLLISGPGKVGGQDEQRTDTTDAAKDVKITPVAANNTTYTVTINGQPFSYVSDADATVAEITAGLTAQIDAGVEPVDAIDNGTDLDVESTDGEVFSLELSPSSLLSYANNDLGHEMQITVCGLREITVSCQVVSDDPIDPAAHSRAALTAAQAALNLPSELVLFRAAGLAPIEEGPVTNLDELVEDKWLSRSNMDVRFYLASNVQERTGYLATVLVSSDMDLPPSLELDDEPIGA